MNNVQSCSVKYVINADAHAAVVKVAIVLPEWPQQLLDCGYWSGYYRDQVEFFALESDEEEVDPGVTVYAIIRIEINPGYDDAAESLLGRKLWELYDDKSGLHTVAHRESYVLTIKEAQTIVNRLLLNSTFSS